MSRLLAAVLVLLTASLAGAAPPRVVYGGDAGFPPFEYLDAQGQPRGFNVELVRALGRDAGVDVEVRLGRWGDVMDAFDVGRVDVMSLARSEARLARYDFLAQTWTLHQAVLFNPGRGGYPQRLDLLASEILAVEPRSLVHELILELPEIQRPVLVPATSQYELVRFLESGRATAIAGNALSLRFSAAELGVHDLVVVPVKALSYHLAVRHGQAARFAWMDAGLVRLRATGEFDRLVEGHLAVRPPPGSWRDYAAAFASLFGLVVVVTVGAVVWNRSLKRQVRLRTEELAASLAEKERLAEALRMSEAEARAASANKSEFLASMSHEIRTPLSGVLGMTRMLLETPLSPQQRDYARAILGSGSTLLALVSDVLDVSKIEAGKLELESIPFDLAAAVEDVVRIFRDVARAKGLDLTVRLGPDVPAAVQGDPLRLQQILGNLLGNAVKFTDRGGVSVTVGVAGETADGLRMRFEVADTGVGIDAEAQGRLFQPFSQADGSTARRYGGTGLGLAIAKQLAERMGGEIGVRSTPGSGSTFSFTVRLDRAADRPAAPAPSAALAQARFAARVLVADDNPVNQKVTAAFLEGLGCSVQLVADGAGALAAFSSGRFDAVLMDCQMPVMDGYEACREMRRREGPDRHTPVIAITAGTSTGERGRCVDAGMDDYLAKPFGPVELAAVLGRWLSTTARPAPVDPRVIAEIRSMTSEGFLEEAIGVFLGKCPGWLEDLKRAAEARDGEALARTAHKLKGGCGLVGAMGIAERSGRIEELATEGRLDEAAALVGEIFGEYPAVRATLEAQTAGA